MDQQESKWGIERMKPGQKAEATTMVTIHWKDHHDAPRVTPPIFRARIGDHITFRVIGKARTTINLPEHCARPFEEQFDGPGEIMVEIIAGRGAVLPDGYMYTYRIDMEHLDAPAEAGLRFMEAVGHSPPGMVLEEPPPSPQGTRN